MASGSSRGRRRPEPSELSECVRRAVADLVAARGRSAPCPIWTDGATDHWAVVQAFAIRGTRVVVLCSCDTTAARALTSRERQVANLASAGESNKAIGYRLGISASTVGVLLSRASSKLGVRTRAELEAALRDVAPPEGSKKSMTVGARPVELRKAHLRRDVNIEPIASEKLAT